MNDENLERLLRQLPAPELPESWRGEILAAAGREVRAEKSACSVWPPILIWLRNVFARNPFASGVLASLWLLILLFRFTTPVDPQEREILAHTEPGHSIYLITMTDEIRLVESIQDQSSKPERIP